jgi:phospholipid-translocating ATPase
MEEPTVDQGTSENPPPDEKKDPTSVHAGIPLNEMIASGSSSGGPRQLPIRNSSTTSETAAVPILGFSDPEKPDPLTSPEPVSTAHAPPKVKHHFHDEELKRDLEAAVQPDLDPATAAHARNLNGFFTVLALCHTVLAAVDPDTGKLEYKAQSPDEAALVQAAADMGFVFRGREKEILYLQTPFGTQGPIENNNERREGSTTPLSPDSRNGLNADGVPIGTGTGPHVGSAGGNVAVGRLYEEGTVERYELLNILEFTSARKRMSVVLKKLDSEDGRLFLLCKGADNVIFERLKEGAIEDLKIITERDLADFAGQGLRTLTLAYKVIGGEIHPHFFLKHAMNNHVEEEYRTWSDRYHEASIALENRDEKLEAVSDEIEHDLRLLGATAIEDRLQDGVPETIADLKTAGIKLWVATGDKLETAIGMWCK